MRPVGRGWDGLATEGPDTITSCGYQDRVLVETPASVPLSATLPSFSQSILVLSQPVLPSLANTPIHLMFTTWEPHGKECGCFANAFTGKGGQLLLFHRSLLKMGFYNFLV